MLRVPISWLSFTIRALFFLIMLTGCGPEELDSPIALTDATGFTIHLLAQAASPEQPFALSQLRIEKEPVLSLDDIVSYEEATHRIELTSGGYERIHRLSVPTSGRVFVACVFGEPIYTGAFWPGYSSQSFDGIYIDPVYVTRDYPVIHIHLGYPDPSFFHGEDRRSDPRILQVLEEAGKLE